MNQVKNIIPNFINVAEVARRLGKKKEWAYQRLNGWNVNGKPAAFKPEEEALIRGVVTDMLIEFCEAIGIADAQKFVGRLVDGQNEDDDAIQCDCGRLSEREYYDTYGCCEHCQLEFELRFTQRQNAEMLACVKRLVNAFSFDKGENMAEQIAALNEAQRILNPAPPSNCKEVCHICGGENGHSMECTSWCGTTVTI